MGGPFARARAPHHARYVVCPTVALNTAVVTEDLLTEDGEDSGEPHRFLTGERVEQIAERVAPLLREDLSWVERRKEKISILDETALRRQISVDFSLRRKAERLPNVPDSDNGEGLFCAPLFVLQKAPANLMGFDLADETDRSLRLMSRSDNSVISAAALRHLAIGSLAENAKELSAELANELDRIALADAATGSHLASRLLASTKKFQEELTILKADGRFTWWLDTLGHSSLVVVLFRATAPRRKLVKLSFEQPITSTLRWRTRLGWDPYRVLVELPLIEARTYHLEAQAPPGLRIAEATLSDDKHHGAVRMTGFLRRIHLYQPEAQAAGAGTADLRLRVAAGFRGGAFLAALLATVALLACTLRARSIASAPASAPALLLVLPALIASYVARPDLHGLTTRLLSLARRLLMGSAFLAYVAAAVVALSGSAVTSDKLIDARAVHLRWWLIPITSISALLLALLTVTWLRGRVRPRERWDRRGFSDNRLVARSISGVGEYLSSQALTPEGYDLEDLSSYPAGEAGETTATPGPETSASSDHDTHLTLPELMFVKPHWYGEWFLYVQLRPGAITSESEIAVSAVFVTRVTVPPFPWVMRREQRSVSRFLDALQSWSLDES